MLPLLRGESGEFIFSVLISHLGSFFEPFSGLGIILRYAIAVAVFPADVDHGLRIIECRSLLIPNHCLLMIPGHTVATVVTQTNANHSPGITHGHGFLIPIHRLGIILSYTQAMTRPQERYQCLS